MSGEFSPHQGIVNMWPVAFGVYEDLPSLEATLQFGSDPTTIYSPYGLRGVSQRDIEYFPGTGYWRGPVWISVNYIVLRGLNKFFMDYQPSEPLREDGSISTPADLYKDLRRRLV